MAEISQSNFNDYFRIWKKKQNMKFFYSKMFLYSIDVRWMVWARVQYFWIICKIQLEIAHCMDAIASESFFFFKKKRAILPN